MKTALWVFVLAVGVPAAFAYYSHLQGERKALERDLYSVCGAAYEQIPMIRLNFKPSAEPTQAMKDALLIRKTCEKHLPKFLSSK